MLDVQQVRGTLEDASTSMQVAVLSRFANFAVKNSQPPTSPPEDTSLPTWSSVNAPLPIPGSPNTTAGPGELSITSVKDTSLVANVDFG